MNQIVNIDLIIGPHLLEQKAFQHGAFHMISIKRLKKHNGPFLDCVTRSLVKAVLKELAVDLIALRDSSCCDCN